MGTTLLLSVRYNIPVSISPTDSQSITWAQGTKDNAHKLMTNLQAIVPDASRYTENMVNPAVKKWGNFVNPAFVSKKGETAASSRPNPSSSSRRRAAMATERSGGKGLGLGAGGYRGE